MKKSKQKKYFKKDHSMEQFLQKIHLTRSQRANSSVSALFWVPPKVFLEYLDEADRKLGADVIITDTSFFYPPVYQVYELDGQLQWDYHGWDALMNPHGSEHISSRDQRETLKDVMIEYGRLYETLIHESKEHTGLDQIMSVMAAREYFTLKLRTSYYHKKGKLHSPDKEMRRIASQLVRTLYRFLDDIIAQDISSHHEIISDENFQKIIKTAHEHSYFAKPLKEADISALHLLVDLLEEGKRPFLYTRDKGIYHGAKGILSHLGIYNGEDYLAGVNFLRKRKIFYTLDRKPIHTESLVVENNR